MINQHQTVPSPEQVDQWFDDAIRLNSLPKYYIARQAALWSADQQLTEDAKWLDQHAFDAPHLKITPVGESLIEAMRPRSPSLKEQALALLQPGEPRLFNSAMQDTIRRALEA